MHVGAERAAEDMLRIASATGEQTFGPLRRSVANRLPWLMVNMSMVSLSAAVGNPLESTIRAIAMLAAFRPVVVGQSSCAGT